MKKLFITFLCFLPDSSDLQSVPTKKRKFNKVQLLNFKLDLKVILINELI